MAMLSPQQQDEVERYIRAAKDNNTLCTIISVAKVAGCTIDVVSFILFFVHTNYFDVYRSSRYFIKKEQSGEWSDLLPLVER